MLARNLSRTPLVALVLVLFGVYALADSQVRAVRLSFVEGHAQIDRGDGTGFGPAYMNMPVTHNTKIKTGDDGRAEVELEDGSSIRLTPDSSIQFPELSLSDSGSRISNIDVEQGTVYFALKKPGKDTVVVTARDVSIAAKHAADFRLSEQNGQAAIAMLNGEGDVVAKDNPSVTVKKNETFKFGASSSTQYSLAKGVDPGSDDSWNRERKQYLDLYTANYNGYSSALSYGYSDLNYYGNFIDIGGYGSLWQPAFIGPGWSPFANGAWAFYPGLGYSWVSAYPWGWLPFHYGNWIFLPNYGWLWQPGNTYFYPVSTVVGGPVGFSPPKPPTHGGGGVVVVGEGPRTIFPSGRLEPGSLMNGRASAAGTDTMVRTPTRAGAEPGRLRSVEPGRSMRAPILPRSSPSRSVPRSSPSVPRSLALPAPSFGPSFGRPSGGLGSVSVSHGGRVH